MRIIISPAKKMLVEDLIPSRGKPVYFEKAQHIYTYLKNKSLEELQTIWRCNSDIAQTNFERLQKYVPGAEFSPAILSYEGIQYKYMAPSVFANDEIDYLQRHLRIISAIYGILKPLDPISPYRLEMQADIKIGYAKDLYDFWGEDIYREIVDKDRVIINLASKEYSKSVEKYLRSGDRFITCIFAQYSKDKLVQKGTYAKMARGEMVRYMAENAVFCPEQIKTFNRLGYEYSETESTDTEFVFIQKI